MTGKRTSTRSVQRNKRNSRTIQKNRRQQRILPAAYTSSARAQATFNRRTSTISFQEIFPIDLQHGTFMLPFSPTKWTGTRTRALCQTYGSFRPLDVAISYQPAVATVTPGIIAIGTVFNGNRIDLTTDVNTNISSISSLANALMTQVYQPVTMPVKLGVCLSQNNYPTTLIDDDDIPFWIVASSTVTNPGYVIINARISVHNPMNIIDASVGGSFVGTIQRPTESETQTTLVTTSSVPGVNVGDSIKMMASQELVSVDGSTLYHALEPIVATVKSIAANAVTFIVNNALASTTARFVPVGLYSTANFL